MLIKNLYKKYEYVWLSLIVVVTWGLVPLFAKIQNLPLGQTTMWVDGFGALGVLAIMMFLGKLPSFKKGLPYAKYAAIGVLWPFAYSLAYFGTIKLSNPSLATITNYTWPVFALLLFGILKGRRYSKPVWWIVGLATLAVAIPLVLEGDINILILPTLLGIFAGASQAYFNVITEDFKEKNVWVLTFVVQLVTSVGAFFYSLAFETLQMPTISDIWYLAYLGVIAGSIGFWAFIRVSSIQKNDNEAVTFYVLMCLTPLVQVVTLLIPFWHVESVSPFRWIGVILISLSYLLFKLWTNKKKGK